MNFTLFIKLSGPNADKISSARAEYDPHFRNIKLSTVELFSSFSVQPSMLESVCFMLKSICQTAKPFTLPLDQWKCTQVEHTGMVEVAMMPTNCPQLERLWLNMYQLLPRSVTAKTGLIGSERSLIGGVVLGRLAEENWERVFFDNFDAMKFEVKKVSLAGTFDGELKIVREFALGSGGLGKPRKVPKQLLISPENTSWAHSISPSTERSTVSHSSSSRASSVSDCGLSVSSHVDRLEERRLLPVPGKAIRVPLLVSPVTKQKTQETDFSEEPEAVTRPIPSAKPKMKPRKVPKNLPKKLVKKLGPGETAVELVRRTKTCKVRVFHEKSVSSRALSKSLKENSIVRVLCVSSNGFSKIASNFEKIERAQRKVEIATDKKETASSRDFEKAKTDLNDAKKVLQNAKKHSVVGWVRTELLEEVPPTVMFQNVKEQRQGNEAERRSSVTSLLKKELLSLGLLASRIVVILKRKKGENMVFAEFRKHAEAVAAESFYYCSFCQISTSYRVALRLAAKQTSSEQKRVPESKAPKPIKAPSSAKVQTKEITQKRQVRRTRTLRRPREFRKNQAVEALFEGSWYSAHVQNIFNEAPHYQVVFDCCEKAPGSKVKETHRVNAKEIRRRPFGLWEITQKVQIYSENGESTQLSKGDLVNATDIKNEQGNVDLVANAICKNGKVTAQRQTLRLAEGRDKFCARRVKPTLVIREIPKAVTQAKVEEFLNELGVRKVEKRLLCAVNLINCRPKPRRKQKMKKRGPNFQGKKAVACEKEEEWTNVAYVRFNNENDAAYMMSCIEENSTYFNRYTSISVMWAESWTEAKNLF